MHTHQVFLSVTLNITVLFVMHFRQGRFKATDIFIVALAISDISLTLAIHPMLLATSFGVNADTLFTTTGRKKITVTLINP